MLGPFKDRVDNRRLDPGGIVATDTTDIDIHELSPTEAREVLDGMASYYLGMSGEEFIRAWDAGEIVASRDRPEVIRVAMLAQLGREQPS